MTMVKWIMQSLDKMLLKKKGGRLFYFQIIFSPLGHQMLYGNNIFLFVFVPCKFTHLIFM